MGWTCRCDQTLKGEITILMRWHTGNYSQRNLLRFYFTEFEFYLSNLLHRWQCSLDGDRLIARPITSVLSSTGMYQLYVGGSRRILIQDTKSVSSKKSCSGFIFPEKGKVISKQIIPFCFLFQMTSVFRSQNNNRCLLCVCIFSYTL